MNDLERILHFLFFASRYVIESWYMVAVYTRICLTVNIKLDKIKIKRILVFILLWLYYTTACFDLDRPSSGEFKINKI
jgi:hypothetical protein